MMKILVINVRLILCMILGSFSGLCVSAESCCTGAPTAEEILGNPDYLAISYSGWRKTSRTDAFCPTVGEIKEDLLLMEAMGVRIIRTYNTRMYPQTGRILEAIRELKEAEEDFEMYVMLGAWIQCKNAYKEEIDHTVEDEDWNQIHIVAQGNRLRHYVNGVLMSDVTDNDPHHRRMSGSIGVQVHVGPPMKVEYRNIRLKVQKGG